MRPRTKQQFRLYGISRQIMGVSNAQKDWALDKCLQHVAFQTSKTTSCMDCGHEWRTVHIGQRHCVCGSCGRKLTVQVTRKKKLEQREVLAILDVQEDIQIVRLFEIRSYHRAGKKANICFIEAVHQFFTEDRLLEVIGLQRNLHWNMDSFSGDFQIRDKHQFSYKYDLCPTRVLPGSRCLPVFIRNGFRSSLHGLSAYELFTAIVNDSRAETLLKARQYSLLRVKAANSRRGMVNRYWDSVKICIRNRYTVKDALTWLDYLDLLSYFRKDLRNPKYVCPPNLKVAHNRLVAKKRNQERRREIERIRIDLEKYQMEYEKSKRAFFGVEFSKGSVSVKVLEHIKEFMEEGDIHSHCVYANKYFRKHDSLVLSARVNGKPVETVEVSLSAMKVVQARGYRNEPSEYHNQIVNLVNRNMDRIRGIYAHEERGTA